VFAGMHPELVERLIVEDVGPERPQDIADSFARQVRQDADGWASEDDLMKQLLSRNQRTPEALVRTYAHFGVKKRDDGRYVWKRDPNLVKGFVVTELWEHVSRIKCPTIYVIGGASRIVPQATQERLKQTLPNVQIVTIPAVGHYPDEDNTTAFMAIVNPFLKR
jgi:pimeloyl-ACP methyl ester carboxylesterase